MELRIICECGYALYGLIDSKGTVVIIPCERCVDRKIGKILDDRKEESHGRI